MNKIAAQLLVQIILILLNAFFAMAEIAVISLNGAKVKKLSEEGDKKAGKLLKLVEEPSGFLSTIQIGITLAGFLGSAFAADNFSGYFVKWIYEDIGFTSISVSALDTIAVILITLILSYFTLIFGELVPKRIAMQKPLAAAKISCSAVSAVALVMKPVGLVFVGFYQCGSQSAPYENGGRGRHSDRRGNPADDGIGRGKGYHRQRGERVDRKCI